MDMSSLPGVYRVEHIEIYATAIGTILIVIGIAWNMSKQINTVWKRFDQYKQHLEDTHVSKEVCGILHKQILEDICEIKSDVKKLLLMQKNGNGLK